MRDGGDLRTTVLSQDLQERILARLGLGQFPEPTLAGLRALYAAWCRRVPFDNVRKMIHVRAQKAGPLPGSEPAEFFAAWLRFGTGGTCWPAAGAWHALLTSLNFAAVRGVGTMLVAPDLPPNHGSVLVAFGPGRYLVDCSMLHGEPLLLDEESETGVAHGAWGVRCSRRDGRWHVQWRPLHKVDGFECRFERFGAGLDEFWKTYQQTRAWSPFNYEVTARLNRADDVVGIAFGHAVSLHANGTVSRAAVPQPERRRVLLEQIGLSEEIVSQLPDDITTPPPPGSKTAQSQNAASGFVR
jgi:arylamine N-acetyltransferase